MLAPVTHFLPVTQILRSRRLPVNGRVLVRTNQKVNATDIIAGGRLEAKHTLVNVHRALGMESVKETESLIERRVGEKVQKGDVIARSGRFLPKIVRVPEDAVIVAINNGQVLLEVESKVLQLKAGYSGVIKEVIPDRGAVIETHGALVQGIWGNNQVNQGPLAVIAKTPGDGLTSEVLDLSMRGSVVLSGFCTNAEALKTANDLPIAGLIVGGLDWSLVPLAASLGFPLLVIDGFGQVPMNTTAFRLLSTNDKRDISLNAVGWDLASGERPEAVIPLSPQNGDYSPQQNGDYSTVQGELPKETDDFSPGQEVRIQGAPYTGQVAKLVRVRPSLTTLPNGLRAPAADVCLASNEVVSVPLANLDVIE